MDIEDIISEFGSYYINQGQNMARLVRQLREPSTTDQLFTSHLTDETVHRASETRMGRVLQPFQKAWTPIGEVEFVPVSIEQFKQKIDSEEYPDDLEGTWLGFLADNSLDRKEWPFVRWFIEVELIPQAKEDYELNEIYKGVYAAPTAGTAGAAGTAMNGIRGIINGFITSGRIVPITTGALETDPILFVNQIEDFADDINQKYWGIPMELAFEKPLERRFKRGYKKKYGEYTDYKENTKGEVDLTNLTILGCPSMAGSSKIWCTPKNNALRLGKKTQNMNTVRVENVDRKVKMYSDWWSGVGFLIPELVFTNEQDGPA